MPALSSRSTSIRTITAISIITAIVIGFEVHSNRHMTAAIQANLAEQEAANATAEACANVAAAGGVNAPGNDVFLTENVRAERISLARAVGAQRSQSALCRARLLSSFRELVPLLDESERLMNGVVRETNVVFARIEAQDPPSAAAAMARMDATYAQANRVASTLSHHLRRMQAQSHAVNAASLKQITQREYRETLVMAALLIAGFMAYVAALRRAVQTANKAQESAALSAQQQLVMSESVATYAAQEARLLAHDAMMRKAERLASLGSWTWEVAEDRVTWSPEMYRIFEVDAATVPATYEACLNLVHPEDRAHVAAVMGNAMQTLQPYALEHRILLADGTVSIIYAEAEIESSDGVISRITGVSQDVTSRRNAERALAQSELRFKLAAHATNDIVWDWQIAERTVWFNEAFTAVLGFADAGTMPIEVWYDNIHPDDRDRVRSEIHAALASDATTWSDAYRFRDGAGAWRSIFDRGSILRNDAGVAVRMIGAMADITQRVESEEAVTALNQRLQLILRSAGEGIFGIDREGTLLFINDSGAQMLGWTASEMIGQNVHALTHHTHHDGSPHSWPECPSYRTIQEGEAAVEQGDVFWKRDGQTVPVAYTSSAMTSDDGEIVGAVVTFRDVSARRAVEKMKDEFISTVSHELRTPLTSIRGALGVLSSGRVGEMSERAGRLLEIATTNTDRLVRLINDILDIERVESGGVQLVKRKCVTSDLLQQAAEALRPLADRHGISLTVEGPSLPIIADADRIVQTLMNLIGNAIKFSPAGTTVAVACAAGSDHVLFTVKDRGRGIPEDKLEMVFARFQQIDSSDAREKGGSGLGLAICRTLIHQHGGTIRADCREGGGTVFSFTLPCESGAGNATTERNHTVMVCDDDPSAREIVATLLSGQGYTIREVSTGHDLITLARLSPPDVILLDLFMPNMNGWETLARLKSDPALAAIPVIVISVLTPEETGAPFSNLSGWVQKPLDEESLADALTEALPVHSRTPRLMVIEDDLDLARVIAASFERHGIETVHASNGREAIQLAQRMNPDLIVLDLVLPEIDGYGVVEWLKLHDRWRDVPLVVYSALETTTEDQNRLTWGPTQFLVKSRVSSDEFERRIVRLFHDIHPIGKGRVSDDA